MHKSQKELKLTKEEIDELTTIFDEFWKEDIDVRQQLLLKWKRIALFWDNISNTWYDYVAHDWRIYSADNAYGGVGDDGSQGYYDNRVNVFRAYLESIIAALAVSVPPVKCYPADAELSDDIETAKAGDKIASLIYKHNDAPLLWLHGLFVYMTQGFVASHTDADFNKKYGEYQVEEYKDDFELHETVSCPICNYTLDDRVVGKGEEEQQKVEPQPTLEQDELALSAEETPTSPAPQDIAMQQGPMMEPDLCPSCNNIMIPEVSRQNEIVKVWVGTTNEPKGRVKMAARGGLNIKIPLYARSQEEVTYLYDSWECHYSKASQMYPDLHDDLLKVKTRASATGYETWEQWARLSTEYRTGSYPINNVTIKTGWFRPECFNILEKERAKHWKKKYPDGLSVTFVNELFACAKEQSLDEHWTLSVNPLASFVQNDPLAMLLVSIQEITNDLISLTKQTLEHGVGLTFVDPQFVDLNAYGQTEVLPGSLIPTKTITGGKKLQDGIYEVKTATLSGEVMPFAANIQSLGQLVSGALPSLFGGAIEGSETASQYSMSKNQAQSRLGNIWKVFSSWWKNTYGKAIPLYISLVQCDEKDVQRRKDGSFVNILIRRAELNGRIGKVELEANENMPLTWSQRKDVVMQLLLSPNPQLLQMLLAPENLDVLREAIGIDGFYVIGEDDRVKQYVEITSLLNSEPIPTGDILNPAMPSVEVDALMDNHVIHFEICRKWAVSEAGQLAKIENEMGYQNVILHAKQHLDILNAGQNPAALNPAQTEATGAEPNEQPNELSNKEAPITQSEDINVAQ